MLIPPEAWAALLDAGIAVRPVGADQVELGSADGIGAAVTVTVHRRSTPLAPSQVRSAARNLSGPTLLVVPSATDAAMTAAAAAGWSVLALDAATGRGPHGLIRLPDRDVVIGPSARDDATSPGRRRPGRQPWGAYAAVRHLLLEGAATQTQLARRAGVSQPRVSQTLNRLAKQGLVQQVGPAARRRWDATNRPALVDWWLRTYPGPGGITTYWYGLASPLDQARRAVAALNRPRVAVSGDVAADQIAPWRRAVRVVLYADAAENAPPIDLAAAGLTPSGPLEATLEITVPADVSVWNLSAESNAGVPALRLADALQIVWDVRRTGGPDADQAVDALLPHLMAPPPRAPVVGER